MFRLKIICDPRSNERWVVREDGIDNESYHGAINYKALLSPGNNRDLLFILFNKYESFLKLNTDVIRKPTIEEYLQIKNALEIHNLKCNRKKDILHVPIKNNI